MSRSERISRISHLRQRTGDGIKEDVAICKVIVCSSKTQRGSG